MTINKYVLTKSFYNGKQLDLFLDRGAHDSLVYMYIHTWYIGTLPEEQKLSKRRMCVCNRSR